MKKTTLILVAMLGLNIVSPGQTAGDYKSIGNGNWNDATKWQIYNGSNWVSATTYPGQNAGTGDVIISVETEIKFTQTLLHPVSALSINADYNRILPSGILAFSAENSVSLTVLGSVHVVGELRIYNQNGAKSHTLLIGGDFAVGDYISYIQGNFQTINQDDKLSVVFNTTYANSIITGPYAIFFHDITFDGVGIGVETPVVISGHATFINGIVGTRANFCSREDNYPPCSEGIINFGDGATYSGASNMSFVDGEVWKSGDEPFTFPIGNWGIYAPLTISAPGETFGARYWRSNTALMGPISDPGLFNISNCEAWTLEPNYANTNNHSLDVKVGWGSASGCTSSTDYITNVSEVTLAHFDGYTWSNHGGAGAGTATNGTVTWNGVTNFGTFTLANINAICEIPSGLAATNIGVSSATLTWSAVPGSMVYDVDYKTLSSYYWTNAVTALTSTSFMLSGLNLSTVYNWRVRANCFEGPGNFAQASFTTPSACGEPTGLSTNNITSASATLSWAAVSDAINYNVEYKQSTSSIWTPAVTGTTSLSYSLGGLSASTGYDWRVLANCSAGPGNYAQAFFTTLECNDIYELNNTSNQAKTISLGVSIFAGISSSTDVDWFKVTMPNNSNTTLKVTLSRMPVDLDLFVYNKNLSLIASSTATGISNEVVIYSSRSRNATYFIKVVSKSGAYSTSQCYDLLAQAIGSSGSVYLGPVPDTELNDGTNSQLIYPNPASDFVYLKFNTLIEGPLNLQVFNAVGQLVKQYPISIIKGFNQIKIPVDDIKPGIYLLRINKGELNLNRKFVIAR